MLTFALHDSFGEVEILFFDLKLSEVGCDILSLRRGSFPGAFGGNELVVGPGHDHFDRLGMLCSSHLVLEALHMDLTNFEIIKYSVLNKRKKYL